MVGLRVDMPANRVWSSPSCEPWPAGAVGEGADAEFWRAGTGGGGCIWRVGTGGDAVRPTPKPGTDIPACPKRFIAPWLSMPCEGFACVASL